MLEKKILEVTLRFKTNLATVAGIIHELFCTFKMSKAVGRRDDYSLDMLL